MSAPARNSLFWFLVAIAVGSALLLKLALSGSAPPQGGRTASMANVRTGWTARLAADESHVELERAIAWHLEHSMGALDLPAIEVPLERLPALAELVVESHAISPGVRCTKIRSAFREAAWWAPTTAHDRFSLRVSPYRYRLVLVRAVERILDGPFPSFRVSFDLESAGHSPAFEAVRYALPPTEMPTPVQTHQVVFWSGELGLFPTTPRICGETIH